MPTAATSLSTGPGDAARQFAALCWRRNGKDVEVLLVTSSHGRWILPKGWPIEGKTPREAALIEAWEEAGVKKGKIARDPVGSYRSTKITDDGEEVPCLVDVYRVEVTKIVGDYPEANRRNRRW